MEDQRDLVAAYWRYFALPSSCKREDRPAAEDAPALLIDRGNAVSGNSEALSYLGAGPVEDVIVYQPQGRETLYHKVG